MPRQHTTRRSRLESVVALLVVDDMPYTLKTLPLLLFTP